MWVFLAVTFVLGVALLLIYNRLVRLRIQSENAWADVDVQLKRRHDLIPNLVEVVKAYAAHERETLHEVTEARSAAMRMRDASPGERAQAETALSASLLALSVRMEAYPQLQASGNFLELQQSLSAVEHDIQNARRYYNATVRDLNTAVQQFPAVVVAGPFGFSARDFFQAGGSEREAPTVAL